MVRKKQSREQAGFSLQGGCLFFSFPALFVAPLSTKPLSMFFNYSAALVFNFFLFYDLVLFQQATVLRALPLAWLMTL
jgi:hypothetical protein